MLFEPKYLYIHNNKSSRNYATAKAAVRGGAAKLPRRQANWFQVGTDNFPGQRYEKIDGAKHKARVLLNDRPFGVEVHIRERRRSDGAIVDQVRFRKTKQAKLADTPGNTYLDRVEGYIEDAFPRARWAGDCVCKPDSDHATCRAVDYFDTGENMVKIRNSILANKEYFNYTYVILFDRIWFSPSRSEYYTGVYHSHVHISVGGTPISAC